ncbi:MAG: GTP cyclohydrolase I FolE [Acholeplasmatales bacterium]|nr:GTP cyclohydrolase I FolE [Acholeplasmatales bacterium]
MKMALKELLELCGDGPSRNGLLETPQRVIKAFLEYSEGYREDPKKHLETLFDIPNKELIIVKDIEFYSLCEHHLAPFFGVVHVGYVPHKKLTGLSKIARVVEGYARRFQVQERLTTEIINALVEKLEPLGAIVVIEAKHMCMCSRGIKKGTSLTTTSAVRGIFEKQAAPRAEFLSLIKG